VISSAQQLIASRSGGVFLIYNRRSAARVGQSMPPTKLLHDHIERLCREHDILWVRDCRQPMRSWSIGEAEEIHSAPIRSSISYASALHEIGHVLGRHQTSRRVIVRET
jgi:hypothetical protein